MFTTAYGLHKFKFIMINDIRKYQLDFNAKSKQKSFHVGGRVERRDTVLDYVGFGTMQLRFIIFHKIISLRSVPHNQAKPTTNPQPVI